jgi:hypothetical protein
MRWGSQRILALAMGLAAACGGGGSGEQADATGITVYLKTTAPFASEPDFDARLERTIDVATAYWGGTRQDLDGEVIEFVDEQNPEHCANASALGCYDGHTISVTTRDPSAGTFACLEQTALVHEIGHAVIGDPNHTDPRWMEMDEVAGALAGLTGYTADGTTPCDLYVSVWRHPLGTP